MPHLRAGANAYFIVGGGKHCDFRYTARAHIDELLFRTNPVECLSTTDMVRPSDQCGQPARRNTSSSASVTRPDRAAATSPAVMPMSLSMSVERPDSAAIARRFSWLAFSWLRKEPIRLGKVATNKRLIARPRALKTWATASAWALWARRLARE